MATPSADHWSVDVIGGGFAGMAGVMAGMPFDTAKVRLQSPQLGFKGVSDCLRRTAREEGIRALYKGMAVPLCSQIGIQALVFGSYGYAERQLRGSSLFAPPAEAAAACGAGAGPRGGSSSWALFLAGSFAGLTQVPVMTAVETVKIKLQLQRGAVGDGGARFAGPLDCARQVVRAGGWRALFPGAAPTLVREVPSYGIYFVVYEELKWRLRSAETGEAGDGALLVAGGLAGCFALGAVHPFDVIKTAMQGAGAAEVGRRSMWQVARHNMREHGPQWLARGFLAQQQRSFVVNAATFCCYEHIAELVRKSWPAEQ
jgi:solute carrier family 25 (mitochondrial carnitine/acylcarnitine transporter), member 20/29